MNGLLVLLALIIAGRIAGVDQYVNSDQRGAVRQLQPPCLDVTYPAPPRDQAGMDAVGRRDQLLPGIGKVLYGLVDIAHALLLAAKAEADEEGEAQRSGDLGGPGERGHDRRVLHRAVQNEFWLAVLDSGVHLESAQ